MKAFTPTLKSSKLSGFTLIEILIYIAIFIIIGGLSVGILLTFTQINLRESASAEVTGQLNFVIQTVNRLVRDSSNIEIATGTITSTLKLRMEDDAKDPTIISLSGNSITIKEGTNATTTLTNDKVVVNTLNFKKFTQYPGHDTVSINITMTYNSQNPKSQIQRTLQSAIARVSAATFDSDVLPGSAYNFNLGQASAPWQKIYMADGTAAYPSYTFANNTGLGLFRADTNILGFSGGVMINSGGSSNKAVCWKSDGKTLGYCSTAVGETGSCTCN